MFNIRKKKILHELNNDQLITIEDKITQIIVDEFDQCFAQVRDINGTGFHDLHGVGFVDQGQKKMFKRSEFMFARIGKGQRRVNGLF